MASMGDEFKGPGTRKKSRVRLGGMNLVHPHGSGRLRVREFDFEDTFP
jgi:hypothetical protein